MKLSTDLDHMGRLMESYGVPKIYIGATVEVEEVLTKDVVRGVATNWGDIPSIILKFFPDGSARMMSEIDAYRALKLVQGSVVPVPRRRV